MSFIPGSPFGFVTHFKTIWRGEFDDLPGRGKPIESLGAQHDPDWWVKQLRELAEAKNQAETLVYSTEKSLKEHGDKVGEDVRTRIQDAVNELREVADKGEDADAIRAASEKLADVAQELGKAMYEAAQKEQEELEKLRAEVDQLRAIAQELPGLRAESQRLAAARAEAAARAGVEAEVDPFAEAKRRAQRISCISNIKQICLAARIWEDQQKSGRLPADFLTMSNELTTPRILTCASDTARIRADNWQLFDGSSVSYELLSPGVDARDTDVVYVRCPICNNVGMVDGSAQQLNPNIRVERVGGKFKVLGPANPSNPAQP